TAQERVASEAARSLEAALARKTEESTTASQRVSGLEAERVALERRREGQLDGVAEARNGWIDVTARHSAAMADLARVEAERGEIADALRAREREGELAGERRSQTQLERRDILATLESRKERESQARGLAQEVSDRARGARERLDSDEKAIAELRREQM